MSQHPRPVVGGTRTSRFGRFRPWPHYRRVLAAGTLLLLLGCPLGPEAPSRRGSQNRDPQIEALFATLEGRRVRVIRPGSTVTVQARATDPDGDRLSYGWSIDEGSGRLSAEEGPAVDWTVGSGRVSELRVVVDDRRGGYAHAALRVSEDDSVFFSGRVVNVAGRPVPAAEIDVNGEATRSGRDGAFHVRVRDTEADRFVFSIRAKGYGLLSRIYDTGVENGSWMLTEGTTVTVDPTQPIVARDVARAQNCPGPLSNRIDWSRYPRERWPQIFGASGQPANIPYPQELQQARTLLAQGTPCVPGVSVRIPANALVNTAGNAPSGPVDVTVSTVDLYSPDQMPGDFTVRTPDGARYMESFGAGTVAITRNGESYQLKPGTEATLTIPVDPLRVKPQAPLDSVMPLLVYDEQTGEWVEEGFGTLNRAGDAYVASIRHLSAFNMDLIKTNQACVRIESQALPQTYQLQVTVPQGSAPPAVKTVTVSQASQTIHTIYNLPANTWIELLPTKNVGGNPVPIGTFVANTGTPQNPSTPSPPAYDYQACQGRITLTDQVGPITLTHNGAGQVKGPWPLHVYVLTDATGTDIYPVGSSSMDLYLFSLFDTGSNIVVLSDLLQSNGTPNPNSDASLLNVRPYSPSQATDPDLDVRVRISGLDKVDPNNLWGPIYAPGSGQYGAEVELTGIRVGPRNNDVTLIGAPVTTRVVARIDNRPGSKLTRGPYAQGFMVEGPDMDFWMPGDPSIPVPTLKLPLARFGSTTPAYDNATRDQRVFLRNVTFTNGSNVVTDDQSAPNPYQFLFDTGTRPTIIDGSLATALGLNWNAASGGGTVDCFEQSSEPGNEGFQITSVEIRSFDASGSGTYKVAPAVVCVDVRGTQIIAQYPNSSPPPAVLKVDAVIGANLFVYVPVLVSLPQGYVGILQSAP